MGDEIRLRPRLDGHQSPALQLAALKRVGCKTIFKDEGLSGATTKRHALLRCLKTLQEGDTLIVWKLDRLGRSVRDLIAHRFLWPALRTAEMRQHCGLLPFNPAKPGAPLSRDREGAVTKCRRKANSTEQPAHPQRYTLHEIVED